MELPISVIFQYLYLFLQIFAGLFYLVNAYSWAFVGMTSAWKNDCMKRSLFFGMFFLFIRSFS